MLKTIDIGPVWQCSPCKSFLQQGHPHLVGVCVRVGGVNLVSVNDWQTIINEDVIPDTKAPESTVEDTVIVW